MSHTLSDRSDADMSATMLLDLCAAFVDVDRVSATVAVVPAGDVPAPFHDLIVHNDHMTSTLQTHYDQPVDLHVLEHARDGDAYSRMILLSLRDTGQVVEFGIVRINLQLVAPAVREEILDRAAPLGDILIRRNVLRRVEPGWYFRCLPGCPLGAFFHGGPSDRADGPLLHEHHTSDYDPPNNSSVRVSSPPRDDSPNGNAPLATRIEAYGRVGVITCDHQAAIELVEVVTG